MTHDAPRDDAPIDRQYRCALPVMLRRRDGDAELLTSQVSFREAFVRTPTPPPTNSLVRLVFSLPSDVSISVSAHTTEVVPPSADPERYPGFQARFVALNGPAKEHWEAFVQGLARDRADLRTSTLVLARPSYVERFRSKTRLAVDVPFRPVTVQELSLIVGMEVFSGTVFVPTDLGLVVGADVNVHLVHPLSQDVFPLQGSVIGRKTSDPKGVDVALSSITDDIRAGLHEFVDSVMIIKEYDVDLLAGPLLGRRNSH